MIERCHDYRVLKKFLPWPVIISPKFIYLVDQGGVWTLHEYGAALMIHADMSPECRGKKAVESMREAFRWVFDNTDVDKILATIPATNKPACFMAKWAGMDFLRAFGGCRYYEVSRWAIL